MQASLFYRLLGKGMSPNAIQDASEQMAMMNLFNQLADREEDQDNSQLMVRRPGESQEAYLWRLTQQVGSSD
jgi:hypothetical protein